MTFVMELENFVSLLLFENVVLSHSHSHFPFESDKTAQNACFFLLKKVTATQLGELAVQKRIAATY